MISSGTKIPWSDSGRPVFLASGYSWPALGCRERTGKTSLNLNLKQYKTGSGVIAAQQNMKAAREQRAGGEFAGNVGDQLQRLRAPERLLMLPPHGDRNFLEEGCLQRDRQHEIWKRRTQAERNAL